MATSRCARPSPARSTASPSRSSERAGRRNVAEAASASASPARWRRTPSIALGTNEVNLLELTGAYAAFDNGGNAVWPRGIETISDREGTVLYRRAGDGPGRVVKPRQVAQMLDDGSVVDWGTGTAAKPGRPAAGKTGTSQDFRDAWFIGFTAELVTGIWFGNDDNKAMDKVTGGTGPARLWKTYMTKALAGQPNRPLPMPNVPAGADRRTRCPPPAAAPR